MLYGPNTNIVVNGSIIFFSEASVRYVVEALRLMVDSGAKTVEVKPDVEISALKDHAGKIVRSGWEREFLIVGSALLGETGLGIIGDDHAAGPDGSVEIDQAVAFQCLSCDSVSVRSEALSWRCRVCGACQGNAHVGDVDAAWLSAAWAASSNRVQWKGPMSDQPRPQP